tara:strand:- start:1183 stop:3531 length:2349 start_codon:yes stop_codon:yes gene_type:complete
MAEKNKKIVEETIALWKLYQNKRTTWAQHAQEDKEFRLGKQWTKEQVVKLEARGQAPVVVNRIHPAVETAKAMLTANRPAFRVAPREDSDNKVASVFNALLSYMYDISDGQAVIRQIVDDYYSIGLGYMMVYQDPLADNGKGEVKIKDIDPLDVYVDPNSRDRLFSDAQNIIISRLFTKTQAERMYPMYKKAIKNASSDQWFERPQTTRTDNKEVIFPEDTETQTLSSFGITNDEYIRGYERYYKIEVSKFRTYEKFSNKEELYDEDEFKEYTSQPAWMVNGQPMVDEREVAQIQQQLTEQAQAELQEATRRAEAQLIQIQREIEVSLIETQRTLSEQIQTGDIVPERMELEMEKAQQAGQEQLEQAKMQMQEELEQYQPPQIEQIDYAHLIEQGMIEIVHIIKQEVKQCVIMGDAYLYSRNMPLEEYPIVPFCNIHTRTPYPAGDVRMVKGIQEYINKTRSLIIAHATTSTNMKVLLPSGAVDIKEFEEKWAQPGVAVEVDFDMGQPVIAQNPPLPNELYKNEADAKNDIDHQLGLYEMMMGNSQVAPQTYKATISLDEFGQRKIKSKLSDIESSLSAAARVAIPLMQQLLTMEKTFRVVQPNNSLNDYVINKKLVDDKSGEISIFNDISVGKYDVVPVSGAVLPSNRYAELEFYTDAYTKGLIDRQEVLKKTEVFDMEGVLERTDEIMQLQQELQASQEEIKRLSGDLQTRDRESVNLRKKVEVEKFKSSLDKTQNKAQAASTVFEKRLDDQLSLVKSGIMNAIKDERTLGKDRLKGNKK